MKDRVTRVLTSLFTELLMTYKILLNNLCLGNLHGKFTMRSQISAYETRSCHDISIENQTLSFPKEALTILQLKCGTRYLSK